MGKALNLTGKKFGRLVVLGDSGERTDRKGILWACLCSCGCVFTVVGGSLLSGGTKSCGCLRRELTGNRMRIHGDRSHKKKTRLYGVWKSMKSRCYGPPSIQNTCYLAKNINVCTEWKNSYLSFKTWALDNGYEQGLCLHRIDNAGNYEPENCMWMNKSDHSKLHYHGSALEQHN